MYKRYVDVIVLNDKKGEVRPLYLQWQNRNIKIEYSEMIGMRNSRVGGYGVLYICQINGKARNLYFEKRSTWFVESVQP